jgi:hypothetical protein
MLYTRSKRLCACGCQQDVSASTENRHLRGKGPRQVAAAMLNESRYLSHNATSSHKRKSASAHMQHSEHRMTPFSHSDPAVALVAPVSLPPESDPHLTDITDEPMDIDDDVPHIEPHSHAHDVQLRRSTWVTVHASCIEKVRWRTRPPVVESSDSDSTSDEDDDIDSSSTDSSENSDSDSGSTSEFDEDDGYLSA